MGQELGAKGGKKDLKLTFLNRRRKLKLKKEELIIEKQAKELQKQRKKDKEIILNFENERKKEESIELLQPSDELEIDLSRVKPHKKHGNNNFEVEDLTPINNDDIEILDDIFDDSIDNYHPSIKEKKSAMDTDFINNNTIKKKGKRKEQEQINSIEKQIIQIIEKDIEEKNFQLKKIDSEIHTIKKNIDLVTDEDQMTKIEEEINRLQEMLERIKKQILSLEKTFDFKFPVDEPDNYLIYLVEEYKEYRKDDKDFYKKLQDKKEYISLVDALIDIELKHEEIVEKMEEKKEQLDLNEEQIEKLNDEVIDMEEVSKNIEQMISKQQQLLEQIEYKLNETVNITERVETITKSVNHTIFELFLLMSVLKHNLSIKNNAIAAATAAMALDAIIKMTTPIKEKVIVKDYDLQDYRKMIDNCISDTSFLEQMIYNNLNQISKVKYTFEKDYSSCSYLPSYKEAIDKLTALEDNMKERKKDVSKMKRNMELQLEKNNAKVKKYGSINAA